MPPRLLALHRATPFVTARRTIRRRSAARILPPGGGRARLRRSLQIGPPRRHVRLRGFAQEVPELGKARPEQSGKKRPPCHEARGSRLLLRSSGPKRRPPKRQSSRRFPQAWPERVHTFPGAQRRDVPEPPNMPAAASSHCCHGVGCCIDAVQSCDIRPVARSARVRACCATFSGCPAVALAGGSGPLGHHRERAVELGAPQRCCHLAARLRRHARLLP